MRKVEEMQIIAKSKWVNHVKRTILWKRGGVNYAVLKSRPWSIS